MTSAKRVSIVLPVANGSAPARELLDSLESQGYPNLEVVVEESASTAEALDRGFARASGQVLGYLMPGEVLLPRVLHRVASEVDATRGRHVVIGRALVRVEGLDAAAEYPREYLGRFEHLAIWKRGFDTVPRASVFFDRLVLARWGPFHGGPPYAIDYDFVCRAGKGHAIHLVDDVWSATRLAADATPEGPTDAERLAILVAVSRRHWGSWLSPLRWRCHASLWLHQLDLHDRARHHARLGEQAAARGQGLEALLEFAKVWAMSPAMARGRWRGSGRPRG